MADLKNELKVIMLPNDVFKLWEEFFEVHLKGGPINLDTMLPFNEAKNFTLSRQFQLAQEFVKKLRHVNNQDLKAMVTYLLGWDIGHATMWSKLSINKTVQVHATRYSYDKWVERRRESL